MEPHNTPTVVGRQESHDAQREEPAPKESKHITGHGFGSCQGYSTSAKRGQQRQAPDPSEGVHRYSMPPPQVGRYPVAPKRGWERERPEPSKSGRKTQGTRYISPWAWGAYSLANILSNATQRVSRTQRDRRAQKLTSRDFNATGHKITTKYGPVKLLDLGVEFVQREDKSKERFPLRPRIFLIKLPQARGAYP